MIQVPFASTWLCSLLCSIARWRHAVAVWPNGQHNGTRHGWAVACTSCQRIEQLQSVLNVIIYRWHSGGVACGRPAGQIVSGVHCVLCMSSNTLRTYRATGSTYSQYAPAHYARTYVRTVHRQVRCEGSCLIFSFFEHIPFGG